MRKFFSRFKFLKHLFYLYHGIDISLLKTLIANFSALPFKDAIKFPILVYQGTEIEEIGSIKFNCPIRYGILVIGKRMFYRGQKTVVINRGTIEVDGDCEIMGGSTIHILRYCSKLHLSKNVMICECCRMLVDTDVYIGECTRIAFGCLIVDSEFHFTINIGTGVVGNTRSPIKIGKYNWIGNSSIIKKGVFTPDYTIVSNGTMLTKNYSDIPMYSILLGVPAKLKVSGIRRIYNEKVDAELREFFMTNKDKKEYTIPINPDDLQYNAICNEFIQVHVH